MDKLKPLKKTTVGFKISTTHDVFLCSFRTQTREELFSNNLGLKILSNLKLPVIVLNQKTLKRSGPRMVTRMGYA